MKYRVNDGCVVLWPDGSVRANGGEVFDGFDGAGDLDCARARAMLRGQASKYSPAPSSADVDAEAPAELLSILAGKAPAKDRMIAKAPSRKRASKKG